MGHLPLPTQGYVWVIDHCEVKIAGYRPSSFLLVYGPRRSRGPQSLKKRTRPISSHPDQVAWSIKDLLFGFQGNFLRDTVGNREQAR